MPDFDLIIFDCDGVLIDSEALSARSMIEILGPRIGVTEADVYAHFLGRSGASMVATLRERWGFELDDETRQALRGRWRALIESEPVAIMGVAAAIETMGRTVCVASSSTPEHIALAVARVGLARHFGERLYSATMVAHGKPAPDLFLHAAEQVGARPERCLVIEDSPAGVAAARAAGMSVFAFVGASHAGPASLAQAHEGKADLVFDDMHALPHLALRHGAARSERLNSPYRGESG